jgi:hypothetical protein
MNTRAQLRTGGGHDPRDRPSRIRGFLAAQLRPVAAVGFSLLLAGCGVFGSSASQSRNVGNCYRLTIASGGSDPVGITNCQRHVFSNTPHVSVPAGAHMVIDGDLSKATISASRPDVVAVDGHSLVAVGAGTSTIRIAGLDSLCDDSGACPVVDVTVTG